MLGLCKKLFQVAGLLLLGFIGGLGFADEINFPSSCKESWDGMMAQYAVSNKTNDILYHLSGIVTDAEVARQKRANKGPHKSVLVVHIGKTCGASVCAALSGKGISFTHVHVHPATPEMLHQFDYILITIRDPFDRIVSAFNFHNPHLASVTHAPQFPTGKFYDCFPTVNEYGEQLFAKTGCAPYAHRGIGHMTLGACAYLGGILDDLKELSDKVFLIRTEKCDSDLASALKGIGYSNMSLSEDFPNIHTYKKPQEVTITPTALRSIHAHLENIGEYPLYRYLLKSFSVSSGTETGAGAANR
jgi:hypothetical protein